MNRAALIRSNDCIRVALYYAMLQIEKRDAILSSGQLPNFSRTGTRNLFHFNLDKVSNPQP